MAGDGSGGGDTQVLDGGTPPLGSPVSDGGDCARYCESQPPDAAETQLVDEEDGGAADWMETQLVESGEEDGGDYGEQVETQLEVERDEEEEEELGGVDDNACDGITTQLDEECEAKGGNGGADDMMDTQLVEEDDDGGGNGGDEVDVGEWGKTQLVEDSEEEVGDDESSEGTQLLTDNESLSDHEQDVESGLNQGNEVMNGKAEKHFGDKSVVDSDASTDDEGDADEEKHKGSNSGMRLLPKIVENSSFSTSFRDLHDCGIDSDSHGYVQNHDKYGTKGRDKCSTAKKLFDDTMADDGESNSRCFAGLSYIGSQEPGDLSQANAFEVVDRLISINGGLSSQETTPIKMEKAKPRVSKKRGTLILAEKADLSRSSNGRTEIFEWVDSREDDGGGEFFSRNKDILLKKPTGRGKQKSHSAREKKCSVKVASATNGIGESKAKTNSKQCGRFEAIPLSDSMLLKIDVKSKRASGNRTKKSLLKDLDNLSNAKSLERQQEKDDVAVPDVGPDTQMAVEAMEALAQCSPSETLPAKGQPSFDRVMIDADSKTVTSQSKNGPPRKRTSSGQEGVTTRSKRRKVPESNPKPRKERLTELKMQENSELMVKTKRKQTKSVPEKGTVSSMFLDENKYHGTPVAHRTRRCGRKNLCEYTELCSNKRLRKGNRETVDCFPIGEVQNNHITNDDEKLIHCERISKSASLYFESTEHACANGAQDLQSSRDGSTRHKSVNNVQNLEPCRGEETTDVACREPLSHPKQKRTPTAMVQSKVIAVTQTSADHEVPSEVPRQSKKRRVFIRSVSDLLKYAKREPSSGRSTSVLSSIIGKSLAGSPILSSSVRVDSKTSGLNGSVQRMKESPHVENSKSPENNAQDSNTVLKMPSKVVNDLSPTFSPVDPSKASSRSLSKTSVARELLKLDTEKVLSNQQRKDSRRRKDMASFSILFSHHLDENVIKRQKKILARLGVREAFSISDATHFVADSFYRTRNMLEAIALGKPVVTSMWLENCGEAGFYVDERKYILRDVKKEKELGFSMPVSLASACKHPLLLGKRVFITSNVKPSREVVISLVKASSGKPLERVGRSIMKETKVPDDLLVISCEEDYPTCAPLIERGVSVFSSELVLNGIIIQKLEYERHHLFADRVKQTRSTRWLKDTVHNRFVPVSKCP